MAWVVTCPCGHITRADSEDQIVKLVQEHGKEVHSQTVTREEVMALAKQE